MVFTKEEIKLIGKKDIKYKRALGCVESLYDFNSNVDEEKNLLEVSCSCHGISYSSYKITVNVSKNDKGIKKAVCSCPYMSKNSARDETCKHILAVLLKFCCNETVNCKEDDRNKAPSTKTEAAEVEVCPSEETSPSSKKRKLPNWMKNTSNKATKQIGKKGLCGLDFSAAQSKKRQTIKKQRSLVTRTVYCMTPEEFMKTAEEIIRKNNARVEAEAFMSVDKQDRETNIENLADESMDSKPETRIASALSGSDNDLESLMFRTVPVSVTEASADEQIKECETIAQQLNNSVKEQELIQPSCSDPFSQDLFGSRASNDSELESLMFGTVTDAVKEPNTVEQLKRNKTSIKQLTDVVKETQIKPCNEALSQDLFGSRASNDSELESLMFGTATDAVKEPSTDEQFKRSKTSVKQLTDFVKETQEVVEPCNKAFSQDLFGSCAKTGSESKKEDYSVLDDLLTM